MPCRYGRFESSLFVRTRGAGFTAHKNSHSLCPIETAPAPHPTLPKTAFIPTGVCLCAPPPPRPLARAPWENAGVRFLPSLGSFLFLCRSVSLTLPSNGGQQDSASHVCCQRHLLSLGEDYSSLTNSSLFSLLPLR